LLRPLRWLLYTCAGRIEGAINCFFVTDPAPAELYSLSLHDALPIYAVAAVHLDDFASLHHLGERFQLRRAVALDPLERGVQGDRSEEHTSELQSLRHLVCRLLLEKKKNMSATSLLHAVVRVELSILY